MRAIARDSPTLVEPLIVPTPEIRVQEVDSRPYLMSSEDPTVFLELPTGTSFYVEAEAELTRFVFEIPNRIRPGKATFQ